MDVMEMQLAGRGYGYYRRRWYWKRSPCTDYGFGDKIGGGVMMTIAGDARGRPWRRHLSHHSAREEGGGRVPRHQKQAGAAGVRGWGMSRQLVLMWQG